MPELPENILHIDFGCLDDGNPAHFGFWLRVDQALLLLPSDFEAIANEWVLFTMPVFLDCMHSASSFATCRITRGGMEPYVQTVVLPPNTGSQSEGQPMAVTCGLYLQSAGGGRGSGTRIHLPGLPQRFVDANAKLSGYGLQQLTFAAQQLAQFPVGLQVDLSRSVELVTVKQRRAGVRLDPLEFAPTVAIRPTLRLETLGRRMRLSGGFSSP